MPLSASDITRMTEGFTLVPDPRTPEEQIATLKKTLAILRAGPPPNKPTRGLIAFHEEELRKLEAGVK